MRTTLLILSLLALTSFALTAQGLFESSIASGAIPGDGAYDLQGGIKSVVYTGYNRQDDQLYLQSIYSQFDLGLEVLAGQYGQAYTELRFRYGHEFGARTERIELREAYADLYLGPFTLRAGKQILNWGASGFVNPSDRFSPIDPVFRSPDPDDLRLGTWAINATLEISHSSRFDLLWRPDYRPSVLLTEPFDMPGYIAIHPYDRQQQKFSDSGFGFRYDLRSTALDLQLSYYNGFRNTPVLCTETFALDTSTFEPSLIGLGQQPVRVHSAGLNLTVPLGSYLLRTELGWLSAVEDSLAASPLTEIGYTVEIEQSGNNVSLIAGYYGKYIFDFEAAPVETSFFRGQFPQLTDLFPPGTPPSPALLNEYIETQVKGFNRRYEYQQDEFMHAAYAILECSMFHDLVGCKIPGMYNFTTGELTLMPSLEFNITDGLTAEVGAYFLDGKEGSLYDMVAPSLNAGYLILKYTF